MNLKFQPLSDLVVIDPVPSSNQTASGIVIPDSVVEKPQIGTIIACGKGQVVNGILIPISVKIGDTVLYKKGAGSNIKLEDKDYLFMREEENILAIIQ